jgi:hypothetical protein
MSTQTNIFEQAVRLKLRFNASKGLLTVEDLYDLSLQDLDKLAKECNAALKAEAEESFIPNKAVKKKATQDGLRLELLKVVINTKVEEAEARSLRAEKTRKLIALRELMAVKATESFQSQSEEAILAQIAELEAQM